MDEAWKEVVGYEGLYSISNQGRLRRETSGRGTYPGRIFNPKKSVYQCVNLIASDGSKSCRTIHHLVMEAFVGPRPDGLTVNHINGVKHDNRIENLEYVSYSDNTLHAFRTGLRAPTSGERSGTAKLTKEQVSWIRRIHKHGRLTYSQLGGAFGVNRATVGDVVSMRCWKECVIE
ncbi:NUMOD4 motif-containing HNH endonuclease [Nitrospira sp. BLG_1]|uniref:NUMOD4 motif-containing HNH endonuclease n=1 Tax=Nitrospira sp. BLG_1 TaxID=3395883 RepID=UPI0039BD61C8